MIKKIFSSKHKKENDKLKMENYLLEQKKLTILNEAKIIQDDLQQKIKKLEWQLKRLEDKLYYFEDKTGRKKWVKDLKDRVLLVEKWKYDIITKESSLCNKEIDLLTDLKLAERSEEKKLILEGVIIRLNLHNKEIQELKQELASQTANNIILKDELNKLKKY